METLFFSAWIGLIAALPIAITWGWVRWHKRSHPSSVLALLSFAAFVLSTVSAVLAVVMPVYAQIVGGFPFYDPRLMRIYRWGALLSLMGIVLAICGVWRPNSLRWHAPACSTGMLLFWILTANGE